LKLSSSVRKHLVAVLLGCTLAAVLLPNMRRSFSPWSVISRNQIVMYSSESCPTSRKAVALVESDPRLMKLIVPVPVDPPGGQLPSSCVVALKSLRAEHARLRFLPDVLACRFLWEDARAVTPEAGVSTPSWYHEGAFVPAKDEVDFFAAFGWQIEWAPHGLRLVQDHEEFRAADSERTDIEGLGTNGWRGEL
jgi:hypothetical protein